MSPPPRHGSSGAVQDPCPRPTHREAPPSPTRQDSRPSLMLHPTAPPPHSAAAASSDGRRFFGQVCVPSFSRSPRPSESWDGGSCPHKDYDAKTGQVLVLWIKATVMSSCTKGSGGYEVVYDANWPPGDPKGTVHVAPHHVKVNNPSPSPTNPPQSLHPPAATPKKEMPRPTTTGKSLRRIRNLFPEMELLVRA
ncbi:hypothetical protein SORBI_3010G181800 [Sorghum bicolor]|uniref:Uncharacterized protein n=2 Tax=Sorghum bicolor TaxID=4558 RepID=A0A1W0VTT5_SORBI|nr:hypothetical protein SORBI_3010G181800 [Sorghum bicolor]